LWAASIPLTVSMSARHSSIIFIVIESGAQSPKNGSMRLFHASHQILYRVEGASRDQASV
jgi:hypothetical protein